MFSFLQFNDVTFAYPPPEDGEDKKAEAVFFRFTADMPGEFVCLAGPNGSGKSTFLLLGGGRLFPQRGNVTLFGEDTKTFAHDDAEAERRRNLACSFIYQNMEFETEDTVGQLLEYVYENGGREAGDRSFFSEIIHVFGLENIRGRTLEGVSKGELQRVLLAFSLLYGSRCIFMDEPMFAMELRQKEAALDYIRQYSHSRGVPVYASFHELDLTRKYADTVLLFHPDRRIDMGTPEEVLTDAALERAYGVPAGMLRATEELNRKSMAEEAEQLRRLSSYRRPSLK